MKRALAMGAATVAFGVAGWGFVMAEDGEHIPANWSPPVACESATDCGSPVAVEPTPEPTVTLAVEPEVTATATASAIDSITTLPSTGVGPGR